MSGATIIYIPHGGGPLPLLDDSGHAGLNHFLRGYASTIPRPDAIVVISAHWEADPVAITGAEAPPLLFDYYGFPPETYAYEYPAPGEPRLAARMQALLQQSGIDARLELERGYDHGLFVPLLLMYPDAEIPCVQISLSSDLDAMRHIEIGRALAALAGENLLVLGSGFSFHNMQALMSKRDDAIDPRNREFEDWLAETCSNADLAEEARAARLAAWETAPHARYCHPREEHLLPLQVCYGIAGQPARQVFRQPVAGFIASAYEWRTTA